MSDILKLARELGITRIVIQQNHNLDDKEPITEIIDVSECLESGLDFSDFDGNQIPYR